MAIRQGDKVPSATFKQLTTSGIVDIDTASLFNGKKVAVFGVPGPTHRCARKPICQVMSNRRAR